MVVNSVGDGGWGEISHSLTHHLFKTFKLTPSSFGKVTLYKYFAMKNQTERSNHSNLGYRR